VTVDLRSLEVFVTVAETLHFGRAAERLFLSPSIVTESIQRLENEHHFTMDQLPLLEHGELEMGLAIEPPLSELFDRIVLARLPWTLLIPESHPLALLDDVPLDRLAGEDVAHVGPASQSPQQQLIATALRAADVTVASSFDAIDEDALAESVRVVGCVGISLRRWRRSPPPDLVARPIAAPGIQPAELAMVWLRGGHNPVIEPVATIARSMVAEGAFADLSPTF
jgi:DNA-binding transcriptional LysR family regulator